MNIKDVKKNNAVRNFFPYLVLFIIIIVTFFILNMGGKKVNELSTGELITALEKGEVTEITVMPKSSESIYYVSGKLDGYKENESFEAKVVEAEVENILTLTEKNEIKKYETESDPGTSPVLYIIVNVLPLLLLIVVSYILFSKLASSNKGSMDFGKSRAKLSDDKHQAKFSDVAGLKEEKEEVKELIDFLKNPKKFQKLGARIPKGVLLVGPPGTGKTLLARAVAGVREMFKDAKRNAPCLIFIDEIDAVGRQRGTGLGGGHDEREQTLNQLLTEMDGFGENEGIIIMAATNRPDVLDPALLRPGRFDRQVTVSLPDANEREAILKVHAKNKILANDVNIKNLSLRTPGFSGADLENLLNEAALLAVRRNKDAITMDEIDEATDRVLMGPAKVSRKITDKEKRLVAIHESGHAVIGIKLEDANEVHKITIIPRGVAGGYTMMLPKEEKIGIMTKNELVAQITGLLGGRVSEEMYLHEITTGASDDFKRATKIARAMVTEYGMSDLGPVEYEEKQEGVFLGRDYGKAKNFSDKVAHEIDEEVRKIINDCYKKAEDILKANKDLVMLLADALMENETLTKEQIDSLVKTGKLNQDKEEKDKTVADLKEEAKIKGIKGYSKMTKEELEEALKED